MQEVHTLEQWKSGLVDPLTEAYHASGLDQESWQTVMDRLSGHLEQAGLDPVDVMNAENAKAWLEPHIKSVRYDVEIANRQDAAKRSKSDAARSARASSPAPSRQAPVKQIDPWKAEGRPATAEELRAKTMKDLADAGLELPT